MKYILTAVAVFTVMMGSAQKSKPLDIWNPPVQKGIKSLMPGDAVPNIKFAKIFNDTKKSASMQDYKDQLVIFDFGNTHCSGCVAALPEMARLQKVFGKKIKIFWITPEPEADVKKLWTNNKLVKNNIIPTIIEDSTLRAYFKHNSWPHEAWVYKGKVIALTGPEYVDSSNIQKVLSGAVINFPVKNDFYVFDGNKTPLFQPDSNQINVATTFMKYAAISDYKEKVNAIGLSGGSGIVRDSARKTVRAFFLNQPIYTSYMLILPHLVEMGKLVKPGYMVDPNQIVWEVADKSKYIYDKKYGYTQDWVRANGICFESVNADNGQTDKEVYKSMIEDLDALLGLHVRWEKRTEKVLVLVRTTTDDKIKTKKALVENYEKVTEKGTLRKFRDTPLSTLPYMLNKYEENPYVFDETNYTGKVDLDLNISSWTDIPALRKALQSYGLDLKEEERSVDKLVFSELYPKAKP